MTTALPYRATARAPDAFAPSLGWTRIAVLAIAALGALPSVPVAYDALSLRDCDKQPTPDYAVAVVVVLVALAIALVSVKLQRVLARAIARRARVRSWVGSAGYGVLAVLPAVVLGAASAYGAFLVDFAVSFQLCFDMPPGGFFPIGC